MRPLRVVIVEDSEPDAAMVVRHLRRAGFDVHFERVESADAFDAALARGDVDVIVADYQVPGFGGLEALRMVKARHLDVPFILTSGIITEDVAVEAMRAGSHDYVLKQNLTRLGPAVERELREAASRRVARELSAAHDSMREQLKLVLDAAPLVLLAFDAQGREVLCEGAALAALGLTPAPVGLELCAERYGEVPWLVEAVGQALEGKTLRLEGSWNGVWLDARVAPLRNHATKPPGALVVALDVTDRKQAERDRDELLVRERAARAEAEAARRHAALLADAGRALADSLDPGATAATAASVSLVSALVDWVTIDEFAADGPLQRVVVMHRDPARADEARALEGFTPAVTGTVGCARAIATGTPELLTYAEGSPTPEGLEDPELRNVHRRLGLKAAFAVPLVSRGKTLGAVTFCAGQDVSPWSVAERTLLEELARRCAQALDNARLYGAAQQAVGMRDEFLAIASHELRTPLTTIELQLHLMERRLTSLVREDEARNWLLARIGLVRAQTANLTRLVQELLDVSRMAQHRLTMDLEWVDLVEVTRDVLAGLTERGSVARAGSEVTVRTAPSVSGRWDRLRIEQVVMNLLTNALKYGGGKTIDLDVMQEGERARLVVRDRGIGIAPDDHHRIFERFERAVSRRNYGGLGLGLYIVRQLVRELGGEVSVESTPGEGATFTVTLPVSGPPAEAWRSANGNDHGAPRPRDKPVHHA